MRDIREIDSSSLRSIVKIAVWTGLSIGLWDATLACLQRPEGLASLAVVSQVVAASSITLFLICFLLLVLIRSLIDSNLRSQFQFISVFVAFFLGTLITLLSLQDLFKTNIHYSDLLIFLVIGMVSVSSAVGVFYLSKAIELSPRFNQSAIVILSALPFFVGETLLLVWVHRYRLESFVSKSSLLVNTGYVAIIILIFWITKRIKSFHRNLAVVVFMMFVIGTPFFLRVAQGREQTRKESGLKHKIKRVILISIDTLRQDVLSAYASKDVNSPNIDQLARDGFLFENAYSCAPWTIPSMTCIFTGKNTFVHGVEGTSTKIPKELRTLAEDMLSAGYLTAAIGRNGFLKERGMDRGFVEFNIFPKSSLGPSLGAWLLTKLFTFRYATKVTSSEITKMAIDWLHAHQSEDFFLWVHYLDPHGPYTPPVEYVYNRSDLPLAQIAIRESKKTHHFLSDPKAIRNGSFFPNSKEKELIKELYEGEVRYIDRNVGTFIAALKELHLYDDTLLILVSDHGEEFWEHGGFEHGHTLYNEVLKVPLIIKTPKSITGKRIFQSISTMDILPTILDLCNIPNRETSTATNSLAPLFSGLVISNFERYPLSSTRLHFDTKVSVIFQHYKYVHYLDSHKEELFDLTNDPGETNSVACSSPELLEKGRSILNGINQEAKGIRKRYHLTNESQSMDEETAREMKALGYIQ
jgi:arylsulfatase A-like enzyme